MAIRSQLSIMGLWQYDNNIFSDLVIPEQMNKDVCVNEILTQCAELEVVYPNVDIMKMMIGNWSKIELPIWRRVYRDCTIEYNPIWNKDGTITETENRDLFYDKEGEGLTKEITDPRQDSTTSSSSGGSESTTNPITNTTTTETDNSNTTVTDPISNVTTVNSSISGTTTTDPITNTSSVTDNITEDNQTASRTDTTTNQTKGYNSNTWEDSEKIINDIDALDTTIIRTGENSKTDTLGKVNIEEEKSENTTTTAQLDEVTTTVTGSGNETVTSNLGLVKTTNSNEGEVSTLNNIDEINTTTQETLDYHDRDHGTIKRTRIEQGNIGVTKTQEMLADDLALLPELNPYQFIVNSFKKKFCLLVY